MAHKGNMKRIKRLAITGLSNGLSIDCSVCHERPYLDYQVDDKFWEHVIPKPWRTGVVCLRCLDRLAWARGLDVSKHLLFVQFTGIEKTIVLKPELVFIVGNEKHWTQF